MGGFALEPDITEKFVILGTSDQTMLDFHRSIPASGYSTFSNSGRIKRANQR